MAEFINSIDVLGDDAVVDSIIEGTITEFRDNTLDNVGAYALTGCNSLKTVDAPAVTSIGNDAFSYCAVLESVSLPNVAIISDYALQYCPRLGYLNLPNVTELRKNALVYSDTDGVGNEIITFPCLTGMWNWAMNYSFTNKIIKLPVAKRPGSRLSSWCKHLYLPAVERLEDQSLDSCYKLKALVLSNPEKMCVAAGVMLFATPFNNPGYAAIAGGPAYIYAPRAFLSDDDETKDYRRATNWSPFADKFRVLEDYTVDGTVTGDLDESKI